MDKTANEFEQQGESEPLFVHLTLIGVGGVPVDSVATQEYEPSAPTPPRVELNAGGLPALRGLVR